MHATRTAALAMPEATTTSSASCQRSWVAERSEKLVSHHVRALRAAGLVRSRRDGKMVMYALTETGRALVDSVLAEAVAS